MGENLASVRGSIVVHEVKRQIEPMLDGLATSKLEELRAEDRDGTARMNEPMPLEPRGDERVGHFQPVGSFLRFNLFRRRDGIIAVPMRAGPVDPTLYELRFAPGVIASRTLIANKCRIICTWISYCAARLTR
jgi:hypothetical protein